MVDFRKHFKLAHIIFEGKTADVDGGTGQGEESTTESASGTKAEKTKKDKFTIDVSKHSTIMYRCIPCNVVLKEEEVTYHRKKDEDRVCTVCDTCGVIFTSRKAWKQHMAKHAAEKTSTRFICKVCNRAFIVIRQLKKHMKLHSKNRPHVCEVCGRSFKQRNALYRHRFVHSDIKPHTCEYCGKGFTDRYNLKGHLRTHTGEKPFQCDICTASFTHNVSLKTHKKTAHGIDMWKVQKSQLVEEYDNFNINDPNAYKKGELVKTTPDEKSGNPSPVTASVKNFKKAAAVATNVEDTQSDVQAAPHSSSGESKPKLGFLTPTKLPACKRVQTTQPDVKTSSTPSMSHPAVPPLPIPQGYMQYNEVRQFIPLMLNPFEYGSTNTGDVDRGINEATGRSFTNL